MSAGLTGYLVVGKFGKVHGVKGWISIHSFTDPLNNIFSYTPWYIQAEDTKKPHILTIEHYRADNASAKKLVKLKTIDTPEQASCLVNKNIYITQEQLPALAENQYYWYELEGLSVYLQPEQPQAAPIFLGKITEFIATVSHDVMVVKPCQGSIDQKKRLIPYILKKTVLTIDLSKQYMLVDWFLDD